MLKIGDMVAPTKNMPKLGTVVDVHFKESTAWFVGGSSGPIRFLLVEHDDGDKVAYTSNDLTQIFE